MSAAGDGSFQKGDPVWVVQGDGSQRAGEYVGEAEGGRWLAGAPSVLVVYSETHVGEAVEVDRVIPRDG